MAELALEAQPLSKMVLGCEVKDIIKSDDSSTIVTNQNDFKTKHIVFCAGLQADRLAKKDGVKLKTNLDCYKSIFR